MKKRNLSRRILSFLLAFIMVLGYVITPVSYASGDLEKDQRKTLEERLVEKKTDKEKLEKSLSKIEKKNPIEKEKPVEKPKKDDTKEEKSLAEIKEKLKEIKSPAEKKEAEKSLETPDPAEEKSYDKAVETQKEDKSKNQAEEKSLEASKKEIEEKPVEKEKEALEKKPVETSPTEEIKEQKKDEEVSKPVTDDDKQKAQEEKKEDENQAEEKPIEKNKPSNKKEGNPIEKEKPTEEVIPVETPDPDEEKPVEKDKVDKGKIDKSHYPKDWEHFPFDYEKFLKDLEKGIISGNYDEISEHNSPTNPSNEQRRGIMPRSINLMSRASTSYSRSSGTRWKKIPGYYTGTSSYYTPAGYLYQNGNLVFCIEQGVDISTGFNGYSTTNLSSYFGGQKAKALALIAHFGYYSQKSARNYVFTQRMLWEAIHPSRTFMSGTSYANKTNLNSSYNSWKRNVINKINAFNALPSFNRQTRSLEAGQTVTFTDIRYGGQVLNYSKAINTPPGVKVTTTGSKLSISIDERVTKPFTLKLVKYPQGWSNRRQLDFVYKARGVQNLSTVPIPAKFEPTNFKVTINPVVKGSLNLIKRDTETNYVLTGASFEVRNSKGQLVKFTGSQNTSYKATTSTKGFTEVWVGNEGENRGVLRLRDLPLDTYTIKEVKAPGGYELKNSLNTIKISDKSLKRLTVTNNPTKGQVNLIKRDAETNYVLTGASFEVRNSKGQLVKFTGSQNTSYEATTSTKGFTEVWVGNEGANRGVLRLRNLPLDTYTIKEVKAPAGYVVSTSQKMAKVTNKDLLTLEIKNNPTWLKITKQDSTTSEGLQNTGFEIRNSRGRKMGLVVTKDYRYEYKPGSRKYVAYTDKEGTTWVRNLPKDKYSIREVTPPKGYAKAESPEKIIVINDKQSVGKIGFYNQKTKVLIYKYDGKTKKVLANTEFILHDSNGKPVPIKPTGTFNTPDHKYLFDENAKNAPRYKMYVKNDGYLAIEGLPVGTYKLIETKPLEGYRQINDRYITVTTSSTSKSPVRRNIANYLDVGSLSVAKIDSLTKKYIEGAHIELWKDGDKNQKVKMLLRAGQDPDEEEKFYDYNEKGQSFIYTSDKGYATVENLPIGRYRLVESKKPNAQYEEPNKDLAGVTPSSKLSKDSPYWINVTDKKKSLNFTLLNHKKPSIVRVNKVDENGKPVENALLNILEDNGRNGEKLVREFYTKSTAYEATGLKRGQKYILREVKAPDGRLVAKDIHFRITADDMQINLTMIDYPVPEITTFFSLKATDIQQAHPIKTKLTDRVTIDKLRKGENYRLVTSIYEKESGRKIPDNNGKTLELVTNFKATGSKYSTLIEKELDLSKYNGKHLVASQELFSDGELVASHKNLKDKKQTIEVREPEIKTNFSDAKGEKEVFGTGEITLVDKVSYKDLIVGKEYKLSLTVMDKSTNKPLLIDKKPVTIDHTFIAKQSNGIEEVKITLDLSKLKGKEIVAFEKLIYEGIEIAVHEDINDKGQTIKVREPEIKTNFSDAKGEKEVFGTGEITLVDKVSYKDLIVGKEYKLSLTVMDKSTNKPLLIDKKPVTIDHSFIAKSSNGVEEVEITLDLSKLKGKEIVAFEKLIYEGIEIAVHEDINDKGQTIKVREPEIKTSFTDRKGEKEVFNKGKVTLVDKVSYKDLIVGKEYKLSLTVMDKSTNKPLLIDKKPITIDHTFIAKQSNGIEEVEITLDLSKLKGKEIVAFEKLIYEGIEIAVHEDINDKGQTIKVREPEIKTNFSDIKGEKEVFNKGKVTLVDKVSYKDLIVGKEYKLSLTVMDKSTNKPLLIDKKPVTIDHTFIAKQSNGIEEVKITLDLSKLKGKEIVAFEKLIYEGMEIAVHEDINDKSQTVKVKEIKTPPILITPPKVNLKPKTEDRLVNAKIYLLGGISFILLASGIVIINLNRSKKGKNDKRNNEK